MTEIQLTTVGLGQYRQVKTWDLPEADRSRAAVEALFGKHGIPARDLTQHATSGIDRKLAETIASTGAGHIVYWVGHGEYSGHGYRIALADSESPLDSTNCLTGTKLFEILRDYLARRGDDDQGNWVLLILDTCGSSEGKWQIWSSFSAQPENVGIVATTQAGAAFAGRFTDVLSRVLGGFTGNDTTGIPLRELVRRLEDADVEVDCRFAQTAKLPPRSDWPPPASVSLDVYQELQEVLAMASPAVRGHFYEKAKGSEIGEPAWYFAGRLQERLRIAEWLENSTEGMFVVSGVAGSGKSALLGMMLASSDHDVSKYLSTVRPDIMPQDFKRGDATYDAVVHLRGQTVEDMVVTLAQGLGIDGINDPDALVDALRTRENGATITIMADALDEARDPLTIATTLRRIAAVPDTRILVGTRQSLGEDPDRPIPPDSVILETLAATGEDVLFLGREPEAMQSYVVARLSTGNLSLDAVERVAAYVAGYPQPFLFARLAVHEILANPLLAMNDADLEELLSQGHQGIFAHAVRRLAESDPDAEALLHALTYAKGSGFPRTGGIWAIAASAVRGRPVSDLGVEAALKSASPYILHDSEFGQGVYRLAHRTFVEWYRREDAR